MRTPAVRARLARKAEPYATSLTDAGRVLVQPFLPPPAGCGRLRRWALRLFLDAPLHALPVAFLGSLRSMSPADPKGADHRCASVFSMLFNRKEFL